MALLERIITGRGSRSVGGISQNEQVESDEISERQNDVDDLMSMLVHVRTLPRA